MHKCDETGEEHLAVVLGIEVCRLLRAQSEPALLHVHGINSPNYSAQPPVHAGTVS